MKRINAILFFVMCACFLSIQVASQTAATKRGDARVEKALKQTKTPFEKDKDGDYKVIYELSDKRLQVVHLILESEKAYGLEVRGIFSYAMVSDNPPSQETASILLQQNMENISAWAVLKMNDGKYALVNVKFIPADADGKTLEAAMLSVANAADEFERRLTKKDEF
jgi:hypothetical protein